MSPAAKLSPAAAGCDAMHDSANATPPHIIGIRFMSPSQEFLRNVDIKLSTEPFQFEARKRHSHDEMQHATAHRRLCWLQAKLFARSTA